MNAKSALKLENVSISYGVKPVVQNINLEVKSGEVFGLMGLNGAGKTTMIKAVLGLRDQCDGDVQVYGQPKCVRRAKRVSLIFLKNLNLHGF